jgi:hypothetical protein
MNAIIVLLVIICLIAAVIWLLRGNKSPAQSRRSLRHVKTDSDSPVKAPSKPGGLDKLESNSMFWGVEIGQAGCEAAQALLGKQYTFDEVPQLPLAGCSSAMCTCQFKGLKDHRSRHRRKSGERRDEIRFDNKDADRRTRKERRRGTDWKDHTY